MEGSTSVMQAIHQDDAKRLRQALQDGFSKTEDSLGLKKKIRFGICWGYPLVN